MVRGTTLALISKKTFVQVEVNTREAVFLFYICCEMDVVAAALFYYLYILNKAHFLRDHKDMFTWQQSEPASLCSYS